MLPLQKHDLGRDDFDILLDYHTYQWSGGLSYAFYFEIHKLVESHDKFSKEKLLSFVEGAITKVLAMENQ